MEAPHGGAGRLCRRVLLIDHGTVVFGIAAVKMFRWE
jgi:hypothetical protein